MKKLFTVLVSVIMLFGLMAVPAQAVTEEEIEDSIAAGIDWLISVQNPNGSWGPADDHQFGTTGLILVKLQDRAFELGYDGPFDPAYPFKGNVTAGLDYLFLYANNVTISPQLAGDPDTDGDGQGVDVGNRVYDTGILMIAIAAGRDPSQVVATGPLTGWNYSAVLQDTADWMAYAQTDAGNGTGGWGYAAANGTSYADQSNSGYALLGLSYAKAPLYGYESNIPDFVATELDLWIDWSQDDVDGDPQDGGSAYSTSWGEGVWVNSLKTGNLLTQMAFFGDAPSDTRVVDALNYTGRHWNGDWIQGWGKNDTVHYQATYCLMKGFETMGIPLDGVPGVTDWYQDMADEIVADQNGAGYWPSNPAYIWGIGTGKLGDLGPMVSLELSTVWALLALERFAPPPPVPIQVSKHWSYTNVCFEKDNDNDGEFNEDPIDYDPTTGLPIDNDGDELFNEDPVDCPEGTSLGGLLPMDGDNYVLEAVIHPKNNKVKSYNPGQYYAVSTVNVTDDVEVLTIVEDWSDCCNISALNPKKGGGRVVIVQVGGEINGEPVPDPLAAYQILDATSDAIAVNATACTATATLEDVAAGTIIYMYVKFGPALKHQSWAGPYGPCINYNRASVVEEPTVPEDWIEASANLTLVAKD